MVDREKLAFAGFGDLSKQPRWLIDAYIKTIDAILAEISAQGYRIVPEEPTQRMLVAAVATPAVSAVMEVVDHMMMRNLEFPREAFADGSFSYQVYRAMIDAASEAKP